MSTTTTNYSLVKPELTDAADITAMNGNWDTIDAELKEHADHTHTASDVGALPLDDVGGVHNIKTYTSLAQIGLTSGSETLTTIANALPPYSELIMETTSINNLAEISPNGYGGEFFARKVSVNRCVFETYMTTSSGIKRRWYGTHDGTNWTGWLEDLRIDGSVPMTGTLQYTDGTNTYDYYGEQNIEKLKADLEEIGISGGGTTITAGTTDLTAGVSELAEGTVYLCYE